MKTRRPEEELKGFVQEIEGRESKGLKGAKCT